MKRVYKNTDEIIDNMKVFPVFDGSGLRLDVYLDGMMVGRIDKHNKEIRTTVKVAEDGKTALEETNEDIKELARLVYAEAADQYKIAGAMESVAWVVRNRVEANKSWLGRNTYRGVIHHKGQFTSVGLDLWNDAGAPDVLSNPKDIAAYKRALEAARGVYNGKIKDPTNGAVYFHTYDEQLHGWFGKSSRSGRITPANPESKGPFWLFKLK